MVGKQASEWHLLYLLFLISKNWAGSPTQVDCSCLPGLEMLGLLVMEGLQWMGH